MAASDDELLELLGIALAPPDREPPADRVAAVRAAARQRRPESDPLPGRSSEQQENRSARALAAAAAFIGLVAGAVGAVALRDDGDDRIAGNLEFDQQWLDADGGPAGSVRAVDNGFGRVVTVQTDALEILPVGEFYEVWFLDPSRTTADGDVARISAGTFHPDARGRTDVDLFAAVDPTQYPILTITAEPADGDPRPSEIEVVRIELDVTDG